MSNAFSIQPPLPKADRSFSWWRVAKVVVLVTLLVTPVIVYYELNHGNSPYIQQAGAPSRVDSGRQNSSLFDLSGSIIPIERIRSGGPPKDGIPAISDPLLIPGVDAAYLRKSDRVIGVVFRQEARAYPLRILNFHEVVNDQIEGTALAVTYCPLCDSAAVFDRRTSLGEREFGVSGLLFNSNVLLYDRGAEDASLWSQAMVRGVSGPGASVRLKGLPFELTTWEDWLRSYPSTKVLSSDTGYPRNYDRTPYDGYMQSERLMFPVEPRNDLLPTKERVLAVWCNEASKVYPMSEFSSERTRVIDALDGKQFTVEFNPVSSSLHVVQADEGIQWMYSFWFAWYAMHSETEVYSFNEQ